MSQDLNDQHKTPLTSRQENGIRLLKEIRWLENIIEARLINDQATIAELIHSHPLPAVESGCYYDMFVRLHSLTKEERLLLILSLVPAYRPEVLDAFLMKGSSGAIAKKDGIGGEIDKKLGYFNPAVKTFMF